MKKKIFFCAFLLFGQIFLSKAQQKTVFKTGKIPASIVSKVHLFLAGNFNGWNAADTLWELKPDGSGGYSLTKDMAPGVYEFKVTRGAWDKVECTAAGKPIDNRVATIKSDTTLILDIAGWQDSFPPVVKQHTASANVHLISDHFNIPQLGRQRRIWIYLPPDYAASKRKYPVIYMHDGQNLFDAYTSGYGEWGIDELLDKMPDKQESIIVGVEHGGEYRITEYDPYDSKYGKGRGDDYVDFLAKTLKPYIDSAYRTKPGPRSTTIAGSSMGGLIAIYAALKYPDVFGNAGIFSPAFWIAPAIYDYVEGRKLPGYERFYFVCGDAESKTMVSDMQKMADIVHAKGKNAAKAPVVIIKGAIHNEKQWNSDFPGFYEWVVGRKAIVNSR
jgi:predicted alpha/beta superfamily hydrolase